MPTKKKSQDRKEDSSLNAKLSAKPTLKRPARKQDATPGPGGIVITPANLVPGQINVITPPPGFPGRALLWPPPAPPTVVTPPTRGQYTFVLYVGHAMGPVSVEIPNLQGFLFADLPEGIRAPAGYATLFDALKVAINAQIEPPPPDGTNDS
jgi:hypothetical protein